MKGLTKLLENNKSWAEKIKKEDPSFFERLSKQQTPKYLWIGCSDSRVPANQITGLGLGEIFVHRNVANLVIHTDINCLSVIQFAIEALGVTDIIVCGHYSCGGVMSAIERKPLGLIDNWIRHIKDVYSKYYDELEKIEDKRQLTDRLCELNVREQVLNVSRTSTVQNYWQQGNSLSVHGLIYGLDNGLLKNLEVTVSSPEQIETIFKIKG